MVHGVVQGLGSSLTWIPGFSVRGRRSSSVISSHKGLEGPSCRESISPEDCLVWLPSSPCPTPSLFCCCPVAKSCPTLCDPMDCSTPDLPVPHHLPDFAPSSCPLQQGCHPIKSSSVTLFSFCFPSFPALGSFSVSQLFISESQNIGALASASVHSMNAQS